MVVAGKYVIIHLERYLLNDGGWGKDMSLVNCVSEPLSFSVDLDDEVPPCSIHLPFWNFGCRSLHRSCLAQTG